MSFLPPEPQRYVDELIKWGLPCEVKYESGKIKLICESGRVRATAEFRRRSHGWYNNHPRLTVDGVSCEIAHSFDELKMIIEYPDMHLAVQHLRSQFPDGFTYCNNPPTVDTSYSPTDPLVPEWVRMQYNRLASFRSVKNHLPNLSLEHPAANAWQIRATSDTPNMPSMVAMFEPSHGGSWEVLRIALVILPDPQDLALDLGTDFGSALSSVEKANAAPGGFGPVSQAVQAPRGKNDRLVVQRNTVIRT